MELLCSSDILHVTGTKPDATNLLSQATPSTRGHNPMQRS